MCSVTARAVGTEATRTTYVLNRNADVLHTFEGAMYIMYFLTFFQALFCLCFLVPSFLFLDSESSMHFFQLTASNQIYLYQKNPISMRIPNLEKRAFIKYVLFSNCKSVFIYIYIFLFSGKKYSNHSYHLNTSNQTSMSRKLLLKQTCQRTETDVQNILKWTESVAQLSDKI